MGKQVLADHELGAGSGTHEPRNQCLLIDKNQQEQGSVGLTEKLVRETVSLFHAATARGLQQSCWKLVVQSGGSHLYDYCLHSEVG